MSRATNAVVPEPLSPNVLERRFEAVIFDWDGTAVPDRQADASRLRRLVEEACAVGIELAIVSGTHVENIDNQLAARPAEPGGLLLAVNRGSEVFRVGPDGPLLAQRYEATPEEDAALSRAAELTVEHLAARGLNAQIVAQRLNRRKIDLIPEPGWTDPPKARIAELLLAVQARLTAAGIDGLTEAVTIAYSAATEAGLSDPRVTSDAKHIEIGLTDKSDAAHWVMRELWQRGVAPGNTLIVGDEFGTLGELPGSDSYLLVDAARRATAASVGIEPAGVPDGVLSIGGGPRRFVALLEDQIRRRRHRELPLVDTDPAWTLVIDGEEPGLERVREALLTLADGRLGTRGSVIVEDPDGRPSVLLSGIYAGAGADTTLLHGPGWNSVAIAGAAGLEPRRILDLHTGTLSQQLAAGPVRVEATLLSSLARPAATALRVRGRGIPPPSLDGLQPPGDASTPDSGVEGEYWWMRVTTPPGSIAAASHEQLDVSTEAWALDRVSFYEGSPAGVADERAVLARVREVSGIGFDGLLAEHRRAWAARWEDCDIRLDGNPQLQLEVRFALFHLIASIANDDEAAVGARGLTGDAYRGHVFWDSDVYVLPFLAATHPAAARAMLEYRVRRLPAALRTARAAGRAGARFPWESAASGVEVTPDSVLGDRGQKLPVYTGRLAEHIVADVAWGAAHYIDWTDDEVFAAGRGLELLVQTARYWASRIELDDDGRGHLRDVIGPDEYHEHVDDNAYTNVMARWNLRRAADAASGALDEGEHRRWLELAESLVDGYDQRTGIYEQFAGFHALEPLVIADIATQRPVNASRLLGAERTRASQVVKQPDVLMLHYLIPREVAAGSLPANLDFYEPRTALGSSLSAGVHAALLARAGRPDQALELLRLTARVDLDDIDQITGGGVRLAAMGSLWRALALGFAGIQPQGDQLAIDPIPVPGLDALDLRVLFRGSVVRVRITQDAAEVTSTKPITVLAPDGTTVNAGPKAHNLDL